MKLFKKYLNHIYNKISNMSNIKIIWLLPLIFSLIVLAIFRAGIYITKLFSLERFVIATTGEWLAFFGAIIGGCITLLGVERTIINQNKEQKELDRKRYFPYFELNENKKIGLDRTVSVGEPFLIEMSQRDIDDCLSVYITLENTSENFIPKAIFRIDECWSNGEKHNKFTFGETEKEFITPGKGIKTRVIFPKELKTQSSFNMIVMFHIDYEDRIGNRYKQEGYYGLTKDNIMYKSNGECQFPKLEPINQ